MLELVKVEPRSGKLLSLEELPEFFHYNIFEVNQEFQVHEIARITYRLNNNADKPYRLQDVLHVVGRSVNQGAVKGPKQYTLFCARQAMTRWDGSTIAVNSTGTTIRTSNIEWYEVLRDKEDLYHQSCQRK